MVDPNVITRTVGVDVVYQDTRSGTIGLLPQRIAVIGQGESGVSYGTAPRRVTSAAEAPGLWGQRSPLYLMLRELFNRIPEDSVGAAEVTVYPVQEAGSAAFAVGDITPSGTATRTAYFQIVCNGIKGEKFAVAAGAVVPATVITSMIASFNAVAYMPAVASDGTTKCTITSSWKGASANALSLSVIGDMDAGVVFGITQPTGGAINPPIGGALALFGTRWETLVLNQMEFDDTTTLDALQTAGESRWDELVKMPFVAFTGNTQPSVLTATSVSSVRRTDRVNAYLTAPGAAELPFVVAAAQLAKVARTANSNPATGYGAIPVPSLTPGSDSVQWTQPQRNAAKAAGCSTSVVVDGEVQVNDVVTFYRPTGEDPPAYREVVQIVKLMNAVNVINTRFSRREWAAAPLLPDRAVTTNPNARKPKSAKAAIYSDLIGLQSAAIITDAKAAMKATTVVAVGDRLDIDVPFNVSGNTHVKAITLHWGFDFGG